MEKLIHKATGELISADPFRTIGTKLRYLQIGGCVRVGIITKTALACVTHDTSEVWAVWFDEHSGGIPSGLNPETYNDKKSTRISKYREPKIEVLEVPCI